MNEDKHSIKWRTPPNHGWIEYKLSQTELDYVWKCVDIREKNNCNSSLAGNIDSSFTLYDEDDWFFKNTILPLISHYNITFKNLASSLPVMRTSDGKEVFDYKLGTWWVNYQKQHEFNPVHAHKGVYSFVIWLKIPTEYEEQNKDFITNAPEKSTFGFVYTDILGHIESHSYKMGKEFEGTLLLFPSTLKHTVHPFYDCKEDRISVSGNIFVEI